MPPDMLHMGKQEKNQTSNNVINGYSTTSSKLYISIKGGYRYIFSDSRTGVYVEPAIGYGRVAEINEDQAETTYGDGLALAFETGYSLEVGQRGHVFCVGIKYESDRGGSKLNSVGLRLSYAFNMFRRRSAY